MWRGQLKIQNPELFTLSWRHILWLSHFAIIDKVGTPLAHHLEGVAWFCNFPKDWCENHETLSPILEAQKHLVGLGQSCVKMCQRAVLTILPMRGKKLLVVRMGHTRFFNTLGGLHDVACLDSGSVGLCKVQRGGSAHGQTGIAVV